MTTIRLIDSHAHLTYPGLYDRIDEVRRHCAQAGGATVVDHVITIATDGDEARRSVALAAAHPGFISVAIGIHPHHAAKARDADWATLENLADEPSVVAFGEMGLDYHYDFAPRDTQAEVFRRQLRAAADRDKSIVIHSREAYDDVERILLDHGFRHRRVVFHCFTGTANEARRIADHGWRLSFTGIVTFRNSTQLQAIARDYPSDALMIETDAPYLSPEPVRSRRPNEPAHVAHIARFLADLRGEPLEELARRTRENTIAFFGLPESLRAPFGASPSIP